MSASMTRWWLAVSLAALGALLVGCDGARNDGRQPDGDWVLTEGVGPDGAVPIVADADITLGIDGEEWGGTAACNHYGATVTADGGELTVSGLFRTEMACLGEQIMESEGAYLEAFHRVDRFGYDQDDLVLTGDAVRLRYAPDRP